MKDTEILQHKALYIICDSLYEKGPYHAQIEFSVHSQVAYDQIVTEWSKAPNFVQLFIGIYVMISEGVPSEMCFLSPSIRPTSFS